MNPLMTSLWKRPRKLGIAVDIVWSGIPGEEPWRYVKYHRPRAYRLYHYPFEIEWFSADEYGAALRSVAKYSTKVYHE